MFNEEELKQLRFMAQAIYNLCPGAIWELPKPDYDLLVWKDEEKQAPSYDEVAAEMAVLEQQYVADEWRRNRVAEYPPVTEQLDMIFHEGIDFWRNFIQEIKTRIPKPETA